MIWTAVPLDGSHEQQCSRQPLLASEWHEGPEALNQPLGLRGEEMDTK